ncbi:MAG: FAD-dependent oxidoreductase, partial [Bryobacteraceae bacterium]
MANLQSSQRPVINDRFESSVRGIYVIGDLAGAPVVKIAMEQGYAVARTIAARVRNTRKTGGYDVIIAGAGAAGLNAALEAQGLGLQVLVLEKGQIANTINDFPEGKWIYAEPESVPAKGKLWFEAASKEDLIGRWREAIQENRLEVKADEGLEAIEKN